MRLSGKQRQNLQLALIDAFPDKASMERMLLHELDKNLDEIAFGGNLRNIVFELIKKADTEGWLQDLIRAARRSNTGNARLRDVAQELMSNFLKTSSNSSIRIRKHSNRPNNQHNSSSESSQLNNNMRQRTKRRFHLLSIIPVIIVFFFLFFLVESFTPYTLKVVNKEDAILLNKQEICQLFRKNKEIIKKLESDENKINISLKEDSNASIFNPSEDQHFLNFYCNYELNNQSKKKSEDMLINLQPISSEYTDPQFIKNSIYISKDDMSLSCKNEKFYKSEITNFYKNDMKLKDFKIEQYNIDKDKIELQLFESDSKWKTVIPAYRWKCRYYISSKDKPVQDQNTRNAGGTTEVIDIGLRLDDFFCSNQSGGFTRSAFLEYRNPYSWYCVQTKNSDE